MASSAHIARVASELKLPSSGVAAVIELLDGGNTVPFIARYRKEATGSLDEVQIRDVHERHVYFTELDDRRATIIKAIDEQGKLSAALRRSLQQCRSKTELEDLYLPYRKKRKTRASMARERGLEPLAEQILAQPTSGSPRQSARRFVDRSKQVPDVEAALKGARDIVAEVVADRADVRSMVRSMFRKTGEVQSKVLDKKADGAARFRDYFDYSEPARSIPSHRYLAIRRGEREGFLRLKLVGETDRTVFRMLRTAGHNARSPFADELTEAVKDSFKRLVAPAVTTDVRGDLKRFSDTTAIDVFAENLKHLLLASPAGGRPVVAIDPGLRTGCKAVALNRTGRFVDYRTLHLVKGDKGVRQATEDLLWLMGRVAPFAVVVGNGTGGKEAESFVRGVLRDAKRDIPVVSVNEAGASIYSASDIARAEFPDLDLTIRGAISIGRRFQDPLAELVKIEPKAIGVGQYQHDVNQPQLVRKLDEVIESCVNAVGVELNTASQPLLAHVSGIGPKLAQSIVDHRTASGPFRSRKELLKVAGLGKRTFEQAAGFLRIRDAVDPLDASAVHPERYRLVGSMARSVGVPVRELVGNPEAVGRVRLDDFISDDVGRPTLNDIVMELKRPGRDPRATFEPPKFRDDLNDIHDLKTGMRLSGVVTNVTNFGAFVDVGVHQDGLVHISQLADKFVRDPHQVVRVGQSVSVLVTEVDVKRKRIALSMKQKG